MTDDLGGDAEPPEPPEPEYEPEVFEDIKGRRDY
jgi:hypothetical protein